ncbi:hypothetical protein BC937DRAFT_95163 [Endogone sp. FLAS-F59071]|nr:hypothetical protein BC937DRAFT_95163 [Endogone sp. FLAS-F59071]|eukprot:RUS20462.1 hypothetical protein BC937DRAFT_95163 [Endogone sp. FLAS-F59071]
MAATDKILSAYFTSLQNITSPDHLVHFLSEPLDIFNLVPSSNSHSYPKWRGPALPDDIATRVALIESKAWRRHIQFLLRHVIVDWSTSLTVRQQRDLIDTSFSPSFHEQHNDETLRLLKSRVAVVGLDVLVNELTAAASASREPTGAGVYHSLLITTILGLLRKLLSTYSVSEFYLAIFMGPGDGADADISKRQAWKAFVNTLCSVPVRVGNVLGVGRDGNDWDFGSGQENEEDDRKGNGPSDRETDIYRDENFFTKLSLDTEKAISIASLQYYNQFQNTTVTATTSTIESESFAFGQLIGKICRLGYSKIFIAATSTSIVAHMFPSSSSTSLLHSMFYRRLWCNITRQHIPTTPDLANLVAAFLSHADMTILNAPASTALTTARPALTTSSLGFTLSSSATTRSFDVSDETRRRIRSVACTLAGILGKGETIQREPHGTGEEDDHTERIKELLERQLLTGGKAGADSVAVARVVICCLAMLCDDEHLDGRSELEEQVPSKAAQRLLLRILERLISTWTDPTFIKYTSWTRQIYVTSAVLIITGYLPLKTLRDAVVTAQVMRGVQRWLEGAEEAVRKVGMITAETLSQLTDSEGNQLVFDLLDAETDADLLRLKSLVQAKDGVGDLGNDQSEVGQQAAQIIAEEVEQNLAMDSPAEKDINEKGNVEENEEDEEQDPDEPVMILHKRGVEDEDEGSEDEDDLKEDIKDESDLEPYPMEESDDEDSNRRFRARRSKGTKIRKPVYIRELIAYLKENEDPDKIEAGLRSAEELIRLKNGIGTEIGDNAIELTRTLLCLENTYELEGFQDRRERGLVALAVASPGDVVRYLIDQLYDKNYSLGQRFTILTVLVNAARELAGWSENQDIAQKQKPTVTYPLPPPSTIDTLTSVIQNSLTLPSTNAGSISTLRVDRTRVFSNKSRIDAARAKPKANKFGALAGSVFFFPLLQGWWEGVRGGWRDKSYVALTNEPILLEKFVMACGVILYCATNCPEIVRMAREFWDFALSLRYHSAARENNVIAAILFGLQVVLTMSVQPDRRLIDEFGRELVETKEWVVGLLQSNQDTRVQVGVARIVVRLKELMEIYEKELWNQIETF